MRNTLLLPPHTHHHLSPRYAGPEDRWHCHRKVHPRAHQQGHCRQAGLEPRYKPSLVIVQVGDRSDSSTYVRMKLKAAEEANIECKLVKLDESITEIEVLEKLESYNNDPSVHGILVQLPLPSHLREYEVTSAVADEKDVDGFGAINIGELAKRGGRPLFTPCTPKGVMVLLESTGVDLKGKNAVVVGRSDIVGSPVSYLLKNADCTVTVCHSKTQDLPSIVKGADIVVAAIGKAGFVKGEWLKKDAVVIDVGTNYIADETRKSGQRLVGDVEYEAAAEVASFITPVPGGVGPMTVAMLMQNVVDGADTYFDRQKARHVTPLPLKLKQPVPSDIEVSRAQHPKLINKVASEIGITQHELEPYGATKAKVSLDVLKRLEHRRNGRYILVAGITPTPLGEGKSTTTIGLTQALCGQLGRVAFANVRQPSQGPTFGIKGGAAGGGYSQVIPMDEFNMHLTGDIHAITAANNLLAAAIDTRMFHEATQKDGPLYKRLVPEKKGVRTFPPVLVKRLNKLGINKTNPDDLTPRRSQSSPVLTLTPRQSHGAECWMSTTVTSEASPLARHPLRARSSLARPVSTSPLLASAWLSLPSLLTSLTCVSVLVAWLSPAADLATPSLLMTLVLVVPSLL